MSSSSPASQQLSGSQQRKARGQYEKTYIKEGGFVEKEDPRNLPESLKDINYICGTVKCFIFAHKNFDSPLTTLKGAEKDREALTTTFNKMNITVDSFLDMPKKEIFKKLEEFASNPEDNYHCLIVCISSHGSKGYDVYARDEKYNVSEVVEMFYGHKCEKMTGKPKIFIVDACRGKEVDKGVQVLNIGGGTRQADRRGSYWLPIVSDILVAYSSYENYVSWASSDNGSVFIQTLVTVLNENLTNDQKLDVESVFRVVKDRVAVGNDDEKSKTRKQQPVTISTLRKLLFLPCQQKKKAN